MSNLRERTKEARTFLTALRRDTRANTLVVTAMALIPLAGMVGGGVDISRMYIVKTRLQHACDAGALAGRRTMGGGTWAYNNNAARTAAEKFFDANYNSAAYGASNLQRTFSESAGKVSGSASVVLPMTLMRIFGRTSETLQVACDAEMRLPNTDVMFVLDTTGSMDETPSGDNKTKIAGLRIAVKCFYEIVARLDTDANCTTGTPSGGTGGQVQIRFGFIPYAMNVNVGKLLPTSFFADKWTYQSRKANFTSSYKSDWVQQGQPSSSTKQINRTGVAKSYCNNETAASSGYNTSSDSVSSDGQTKTNTTVFTDVTGWSDKNGGTCYANQITTVTSYKWTTSASSQQFKDWTYAPTELDISGLKNGDSWNNTLMLPIGSQGSNKTVTWNGCIEERQTVRTTNFDPIPTDAYDLDMVMTPNNNAYSKWGPALPGVIYTRNATANNTSNWAYNNTTTATEYGNGSSYYCPSEAKKLQVWADASVFDDYVNSLTTDGNTYHDIGLLWGARFAWPTGIFKDENEYTPKGGEIERHIIFMTDGDTNTGNSNYTAYGIPWFDRRQTSESSAPSQALLDQQVDLRFAALCDKIKNSNKFTLWVVSFGSVTTDTEDRLKKCATDGKYFSAKKSDELQNAFKSIADQISQLRLTK